MSAASRRKILRKNRATLRDPRGRGKQAVFALIQAVYNDDMQDAKAIIAEDPEQINEQEPFAGLTPLHIAIFHQNIELVELLSQHPRCNTTIADHFGRTAVDMLKYVSHEKLISLVLSAAIPHVMKEARDPQYSKSLTEGHIVPLKRPKGVPKP